MGRFCVCLSALPALNHHNRTCTRPLTLTACLPHASKHSTYTTTPHPDHDSSFSSICRRGEQVQSVNSPPHSLSPRVAVFGLVKLELLPYHPTSRHPKLSRRPVGQARHRHWHHPHTRMHRWHLFTPGCDAAFGGHTRTKLRCPRFSYTIGLRDAPAVSHPIIHRLCPGLGIPVLNTTSTRLGPREPSQTDSGNGRTAHGVRHDDSRCPRPSLRLASASVNSASLGLPCRDPHLSTCLSLHASTSRSPSCQVTSEHMIIGDFVDSDRLQGCFHH